jgi:hypothetical protein
MFHVWVLQHTYLTFCVTVIMNNNTVFYMYYTYVDIHMVKESLLDRVPLVVQTTLKNSLQPGSEGSDHTLQGPRCHLYLFIDGILKLSSLLLAVEMATGRAVAPKIRQSSSGSFTILLCMVKEPPLVCRLKNDPNVEQPIR